MIVNHNFSTRATITKKNSEDLQTSGSHLGVFNLF